MRTFLSDLDRDRPPSDARLRAMARQIGAALDSEAHDPGWSDSLFAIVGRLPEAVRIRIKDMITRREV
jgi:hypothetical protein